MTNIPKEKKEEIIKIVDHLQQYDNKDNLSWTGVYKKIIKALNINDSSLLLSNVVKEITNRGYDIIGEPFKLEKYK